MFGFKFASLCPKQLVLKNGVVDPRSWCVRKGYLALNSDGTVHGSNSPFVRDGSVILKADGHPLMTSPALLRCVEEPPAE